MNMNIKEIPFIGELTINDIAYAHKHDLSYKDMVGFKNDMAEADAKERLDIAKADSKSMRYYDTPQETVYFAW
jgi:hypothetical protein